MFGLLYIEKLTLIRIFIDSKYFFTNFKVIIYPPSTERLADTGKIFCKSLYTL